MQLFTRASDSRSGANPGFSQGGFGQLVAVADPSRESGSMLPRGVWNLGPRKRDFQRFETKETKKQLCFVV